MYPHALTVLIFLPIVAALIIVIFHGSRYPVARTLASIVPALQLAMFLWIAFHYEPSSHIVIFSNATWFQISLGDWGTLRADYLLGIDGLSFTLIGLSIIILLIATIASWKEKKHPNGYFLLLLILNGAIIGTFAALDLLLFYLFFEFMLLPMFFLIGIWGGARREYASMKFFLYTLAGSIFILIAFIMLYLSYSDSTTHEHSFSLLSMYEANNLVAGSILDPDTQKEFWNISFRHWAFLLIVTGFAIKLPAVPLHTWLPDAHVEASTPVSVILAALLLKIGAYGILRIAYPIFPDVAADLGYLLALLGVVSIIYGALNAMGSKDLKRMIAYSSISHMGFVLLGVSSATAEGIAGAAFLMVSHGITSALLFLLAGVLYDRTGSRAINDYSGLQQQMPLYFAFTLLAFFASLGLPGFSGFIGEVVVLFGAFRSSDTNRFISPAFAVIAASGLILSAAYFLWTLQRMFMGKLIIKVPNHRGALADLTKMEITLLLPLSVLTIVFGILPHLLFDWINPFATALAKIISAGINPPL